MSSAKGACIARSNSFRFDVHAEIWRLLPGIIRQMVLLPTQSLLWAELKGVQQCPTQFTLLIMHPELFWWSEIILIWGSFDSQKGFAQPWIVCVHLHAIYKLQLYYISSFARSWVVWTDGVKEVKFDSRLHSQACHQSVTWIETNQFNPSKLFFKVPQYASHTSTLLLRPYHWSIWGCCIRSHLLHRSDCKVRLVL